MRIENNNSSQDSTSHFDKLVQKNKGILDVLKKKRMADISENKKPKEAFGDDGGAYFEQGTTESKNKYSSDAHAQESKILRS